MSDPESHPFWEHARQAEDRLSSLHDFVRWGASRFREADLCFGHGYADAVDEAAALVLHALHLEPELPPELWGARLTPREGRAVLRLMSRRVLERVPTAYLVGHAWFAGLRLRSDPRALVPRSPIGEWIERGFTPWLDADEVGAVLDIGTGGGCIAIACAVTFPAARVEAVDVDGDALALAGENVRDHGLQERYGSSSRISLPRSTPPTTSSSPIRPTSAGTSTNPFPRSIATSRSSDCARGRTVSI